MLVTSCVDQDLNLFQKSLLNNSFDNAKVVNKAIGCSFNNYHLVYDPCIKQYKNKNILFLKFFLIDQNKNVICAFSANHIFNMKDYKLKTQIL